MKTDWFVVLQLELQRLKVLSRKYVPVSIELVKLVIHRLIGKTLEIGLSTTFSQHWQLVKH